MHRRNPQLGLTELWYRLKKRGYKRTVESLFRYMRREGLIKEKPVKKKQKSKPYERMTHPGERILIDMKVVPRSCLANKAERLFQYTAIDEYSRYRILGAYPEQSTYSSAEFLKKVVRQFKRLGVRVGVPLSLYAGRCLYPGEGGETSVSV